MVASAPSSAVTATSARAFAIRGAGARVTEVDPVNAPQACMESFQVAKMESVVREIDFFTTGSKGTITLKHENTAIAGSIGHFNGIEVASKSKTSSLRWTVLSSLVSLSWPPDAF